MLPRILSFAHELVRQVVHEGDVAIDATMGNGYDTLFLCECVGESGKVIAFDIQAEALEATKQHLEAANLAHRAELVHRGHEHLETYLQENGFGVMPISAILFNLGYLPKADPSIITKPETTLLALEQAIRLIQPKGLVSVVLYPCHVGGDVEADAVLAWAKTLPSATFQVAWYQFLNKQNTPPSLLLIEKVR